MSFTRLLVSLITSLAFSDATVASSFTPNCTLPPNHTNYVAGPNVRSTLSILWNCLSIIFLCSWSLLHLNVPARRPPTSSPVRKIWWAIRDSREKVKWMIISILVPELLVGKALNELVGAIWVTCSDQLAQLAEDDGTEWGLAHTYFANIGGFILDFSVVLDEQSPELRSKTASALDRLAEQAGLDKPPNNYEKTNLLRMKYKKWALTTDQIYLARRKGLIQTLPQISQDSLERLNRGDALVKILAVLQVSWLIIQLLVRKVTRLPSSQLEVAVLAFSAISMLTYFLYWMRPQGVETTWSINASRLPEINEMMRLATTGPTYLWSNHLWFRMRGEGSQDDDRELVPLPNESLVGFGGLHSLSIREPPVLCLVFGLIISGTLFGGIHCLAWNFDFPTPTEAWLWKASSISTTVLPILTIPFTYFWPDPDREIGMGLQRGFLLDLVFLVGFAVPYVLARIFIMIEMFRSLAFLPPDAFVDTWSGSFPRWG
ncbi:hypothetical protein MMC07_003170 [Pseudocyphellaria aurata]|nr:hypothetical protein [Pseudocyphellaria aurata]